MSTKKILFLTGSALSCGIALTADQPAEQPKVSDLPNREITPAAGPLLNRDTNVFVTGDFLYWSAWEDGLEFATDGLTGVSGAGNVSTGSGKKYHLGQEWDPGFRLGLGGIFSHDGWDLYADYTWYLTDGDGNKHQPVSSQDDATLTGYTLADTWLMPVRLGSATFTVPTTNTLLNSIKANWGLKFDAVDLELGRNFFISKFLTLRPHLGLKSAWMEQHYSLLSSRAMPNAPDQAIIFNMHQKQNYWGIGVRAGLNTAWHFCKSLSIFGDGAVSELYSHFHVHRKDNVTVGVGAPFSPVNMSEKFRTLQPIIELTLGLRWETWCSQEKYHISLQAGWENQVWFNQNRYITMGDDHSGDLTMQGLTLKGRFGF